MPHDELLCSDLLKRISDRMEKRANDELGIYDVTSTQLRMLFCLSDQGENAVSLKAMERYFGVAQSTMAGVVLRMEKKKLINSFTDPADRRVKMIQITDAGRAICQAMEENRNRSEEFLLAGLNEEERKELHSLLFQVYRTMH